MKKRLKLFCGKPHTVICRDCGHTMVTEENVSHILCPNCGGKRFDLALFRGGEADDTAEKTPDPVEIKEAKEQVHREPLFDSQFEKRLKKFSGEILEKGEFEKTFAKEAEEAIEKGFAEPQEDGSFRINESSYSMQKLFSKLTISVTKTLELDPAIMKGEIDKEEIIDKLKEKMPEKSIMILKKAHDIPVKAFSEDGIEEGEAWLEDSRIINDLELEYNGQSMGIDQFLKILSERYPDRPENIIDLLVKSGTIRLDGSQVTIQSKK